MITERKRDGKGKPVGRLFSLSRPVDLIDLSRDTRFNRMVRREGVPV